MNPDIFFGVPAFPVVLALTTLVATAVNLVNARRLGYRIVPLFLFVSACVAVPGMLGAKLFSVAMQAVSPEGVGQLGGWRYPGAIFSVLVVAPLIARSMPDGLTLRSIGDLMMPGCAIGMAIFRVHCLLVGCCAGDVTTVPWGLRFPAPSLPWSVQVMSGQIPASIELSLPVHPLQIYFMLASLAVGILLLWLAPRKQYDGQLVLVYLATHETAKFLLEGMRQPQEPQLQWVSLVAGLVGIGGLVVVALRRRAASPGRWRRGPATAPGSASE